MKSIPFYLVLASLAVSLSCFGQDNSHDLGSWTSLQLNYKAGDKVTLKAKPIIRHNENLGQYANTSIDLMVNYKINNKWSLQLLDRHWFIPDGPDRQFYFMDVNYKAQLSDKLTLNNTLRYHLAFNWTRDDPDFIRFQPTLAYNTGKKVKPFIGYSAFYRLGDISGLVGARYKLGCNYAISSKTGLSLTYWNQDDYNDDFPLAKSHIFLLNYSYNLN